MASQIVNIPGVGDVEFPDSMSAADVSAAAKRLYEEANPKAEPAHSNAVPATVAAAGAVPAVLALAKRGAEQVATSPLTAKTGSLVTKLGRRVTPLAVAVQVANGDVKGAARSAAVGAATTYGPRVVQGLAARAATAIPASPVAVGAGAGLALPALALAAIQHDANRKPQIDPTANTPASTILRGFLTMAGKKR